MEQSQNNVAELLDFVVRHLVDEPDEVQIVEKPGRRVAVFEVHCAQGDWGKVIGKRGSIANALRTVAKAAATNSGQHVTVEIET